METTSADSKGVDVNLKEFLEINTEWLSEQLDPDFGLLDDLLRSRVLSMKETIQIKCLPESFARSEKLLTIVLKKDVHEKFIESLRSNKQTHLANFIVANGEHETTFGDDWPLTGKEIQTLDTNRGALVDLLETSVLLFLLYSKNVINNRQREAIASKPTSYEKNELLLDILRRKSLTEYRLMIDCLCASNQSHIAEILKAGEVMAGLHIELATPDVEKAEEEIVTKLTSILSSKTLEASSRIWEQTKLRLVAVKRGQSVILYLHIKTLQELICIEEDIASGKLTMALVTLFNHLLSSTSITRLNKVYIDLPEESRHKAIQLLSGITIKRQEYSGDQSKAEEQGQTTKKQTDINDLPLELIDIVLQSAILLHLVSKESQTSTTDFIRKLLSVEHCWFQRITRRRLKKTIWRILSGLFKRNKRKSTVIRNNAAYLLENIQTEQLSIKPEMAQSMQNIRTKQPENIQDKNLIRTLRIKRCLTDVQTRFINSVKRSIAKNAELLHVFRSFDDKRYNNFVRCLRETNQRIATRVIEMGGVVVKLQLESNRSANKIGTHQMLLQKLNDLQDKKKPRSEKTEELLIQLNDNQVEILNSVSDRQTTVWIWCQSQEALQKLQTETEENTLPDFFSNLFESISLTQEQEMVRDASKMKKDGIKETLYVNIDKDQLRKQVVDYELVIGACTPLDITNWRALGVSWLKDKIYVLCHPNAILVFDYRSPFELKEEIEAKELEDPKEIASDEKENCLYVIDGIRCLWKLTDDHKMIPLSTTLPGGGPYPISVSSDGQLVRWNYGNSLSSITIYGPDDEQLHSYSLPIDFINIRHVIQTSTGNFIVLHEWFNPTEHYYMWTVSEVAVINGRLHQTRHFSPKTKFQIQYGMRRQIIQDVREQMYLSLDSDDRVFVADEGNKIVTLLDSELNWMKILLPPNDMNIARPKRMCYDRENKHLIVVVNRGAGVNVYTLTNR